MLPEPASAELRFLAKRALALSDEALLAECRVDVFIATGPGGQHRNKTESGVRVFHEPTKIMVTATERRSQFQNRSTALERLRLALLKLTYVPKTRKPTKASYGSVKRRLASKELHARKKKDRKVDW